MKDQLEDLSETVKQLREGTFDITLDGGSQEDMTRLLHVCNTSPQLASETKLQDATGTLDLFWKEQLERTSNPAKRKQWNPIVLRCVIAIVLRCVIIAIVLRCVIAIVLSYWII